MVSWPARRRSPRLTIRMGSSTYCFGINNLGAVVGYYATSSFAAQAFLYENGSSPTLGRRARPGSQAIGINDSGEINGNYQRSNGGGHGFLLSGGTYTTIDVPGALYTLGGGINNAGILDRGVDRCGRECGIVGLQRDEVRDHQRSRCGKHIGGRDQQRERHCAFLGGCGRQLLWCVAARRQVLQLGGAQGGSERGAMGSTIIM